MLFKPALVIFLSLLLSAFSAAPEADITPITYQSFDLDTTEVCIKSSCFNLEIADTPETRQTGLMKRLYMSDNQGMLFKFDSPQIATFWMKDTYLSLDIIWLDVDYKVIYIHENAIPMSVDVISPHRQALYVIELNAGEVERIGVKLGDEIVF